MPSKIILIREETYKKLKNLKKPNENLSEVIERLITKQKKDPLKHFGIGKDLPEEVLDDFEKVVFEARKVDLKKFYNSVDC
jgi:predicted CopG family antitoxin